MLPRPRRAACTPVNSGTCCAHASSVVTCTVPTTATAARTRVRRRMDSSVTLRGHREIHVLRQDLRAQFIRNLDLESVIARRKTGERNPLSCLDAAIGGGWIEARPQCVVRERLRLRAVEPLLAIRTDRVKGGGCFDVEFLLR